MNNLKDTIELFLSSDESLFPASRLDRYNSLEREEYYFSDKAIRILLLGKFKSGKSSIVNTLIGQEVAAVDTLEKTAWIARYWYNPQPFCRVKIFDDIYEEIPFEQFLDYTKKGDIESIKNANRIDAGGPWIDRNLCFIDVPGTGSVNIDNANKAEDAIADADIVVYVIDINKLGDAGDIENMKRIKELGIPSICVANKYDDEIAECYAYEDAIEKVAEYTPFDKDDIFLFSCIDSSDLSLRETLSSRLNSTSINMSEYRKRATIAHQKLLNNELLCICKEIKNKLEEEKIRFEKNEQLWEYHSNQTRKELLYYIEDYISDNLYKEYRAQIISRIENNSINCNLSDVINEVVPKRYLDDFWEMLLILVKKKYKEICKENYKEIDIGQMQFDNTIPYVSSNNINIMMENLRKSDVIDKEIETVLGNIKNIALIGAAVGIQVGSLAIGVAVPLILSALLVKKAGSENNKINGEEVLNSVIREFANEAENVFGDKIDKCEKGLFEIYKNSLNKNLPDSVVSYSAAIEILDKAISNYKEDNYSSDKESFIIEEEIKGREKLHELQSQLEDISSEKNQIEFEYEKLLNERDSLVETLEELSEELRSAENRFNEDIINQKKKLEETIKELNEKLKEKDEQIKTINKEHDNLLKKLERALAKEKEKTSDLKKKLAEKEKTISNLEIYQADLVSQINNARIAAQAVGDTTNEKFDKKANEKKIKELDAARDEAQREKEKLIGEFSELKNLYDTQIQKNKELEIQLDKKTLNYKVTNDTSSMHQQLIDAIKMAKIEIDIAVPFVNYVIDQVDLKNALKDALKRGVTVKICYGMDGANDKSRYKPKEVCTRKDVDRDKNWNSLYWIGKQHNELNDSGKFYTNFTEIHSKILIVDEEYIVLGSFNWLSFKPSSDNKRMETITTFTDRKLVKQERDEIFAKITHHEPKWIGDVGDEQ